MRSLICFLHKTLAPAALSAFSFVFACVPTTTTSAGTVIAWGLNSEAQCSVPSHLTNAVGVAAGYATSVALNSDGTVVAWGERHLRPVPAGLSNVVAITAGGYHALALKNDGTVVGWGDLGGLDLIDVIAVAAGGAPSVGDGFDLAVSISGTVSGWGAVFTANGQYVGQAYPPAGLSNVVAIADGQYHALALKTDGTVVAWGSNTFGQTNVPVGLSNVVALAAGGDCSLALKGDGTIVEWGYPLNMPAGLDGIVAIAAGMNHCLALRNNGTVVSWGSDTYGQTDVPAGLSNVVAIAAGGYHSLALVSTDSPTFLQQPQNDLVVPGGTAIFRAAAIGPAPIHYQWQFNGSDVPGQTNAILSLTNIKPSDEGSYDVVASGSVQSVTSSNAFLKVVTSLGDALGAPYLDWTSSTNPSWIPETSVTTNGRVAASSGPLSYPLSASLQTTAVGPGTLSFWWLASPLECAIHYFEFLVDGTNQASLHFVPAYWQQQVIYLAQGTHDLEWICRSWPSCTVTAWIGAVSYSPGPTPPLIGSSPADQTVPAGTSLTLLVDAAGTPVLSYQWRHNGLDIAGATSSTLGLTNVQMIDSGVYGVTVTNSYGMTNLTASLTVTSSPPLILDQPTNQQAVTGGVCSFSVRVRGSDPLNYQWQFNGEDISGATSAQLNLFSVSSNSLGNYSVKIGNAYGVAVSSNVSMSLVPSLLIGWGDNAFGEAQTPLTVSNVTLFAAGANYSMALNGDGNVVFWGSASSSFWQMPTGVVTFAAGLYDALGVRRDGTVVDTAGSPLPAGLSNVVGIATGLNFSMALKSDGTITAWGSSALGLTNVPPGLSNVVAIACGWSHALALKTDGTITAWGWSPFGQTNVPSGLSNVVAISAGWDHSLALRRDGSVVAWGYDANGQTDVPVGLANVVSVAGGLNFSTALKSDGSVVAWGDNFFGQTNIPVVATNTVAVASSYLHCLALINSGAPYIVRQPWCYTVFSGTTVSLEVVATGAQPRAYQWQFNGENISTATDSNSTLWLKNAPITSSGRYQCVVSNAFGRIVSLPAVVNVLRPIPMFDFTAPTAKGFALHLTGLSAHGPVVLYVSTNLVGWQPISTNPPVLGAIQLLDPSAKTFPYRFYKAAEQ